MSKETKVNVFERRYPFECCVCGYTQTAARSIMMVAFKINTGHGACLNCKEFLHLKIEGGIEGKNMVSERWEDYMKRQGKQSKVLDTQG